MNAKSSFAVRGNQIREEKEISQLFGICRFVIVITLPKFATGRIVIAQLVFVEVLGSEVTRDGYVQLLLLCRCTIELETA